MKNYHRYTLVAVLSLTTACGLFASSSPSDDGVILTNSQAPQMNAHKEESSDSTRNVLTADDFARMRDIVESNARPIDTISQVFVHLQGKDMLSLTDAPHNLLIDIFDLFHGLSCEDKKLLTYERSIFFIYASHILSTEGPEGFLNLKSLLHAAFDIAPESILPSSRKYFATMRQDMAKKYLDHPDAKSDLKDNPLMQARALSLFEEHHVRASAMFYFAWTKQKDYFSLKDLEAAVQMFQSTNYIDRPSSYKDCLVAVYQELLKRTLPFESSDVLRLDGATLQLASYVFGTLGKHDDAEAAIQRYNTRVNPSRNAHVFEALTYVEKGDYESAYQIWKKALDKGYKCVNEDIILLLDVLKYTNRTRKALDQWNDFVLRAKDIKLEVITSAALILQTLGYVEESASYLKRALDLRPMHSWDEDSILSAASLFSNANHFKEGTDAWRLYYTKTEGFTDRYEALSFAVDSFLQMEDFAWASKMYEHIAHCARLNPEARVFLSQKKELLRAIWCHARAGRGDLLEHIRDSYAGFIEDNERFTRVTQKSRSKSQKAPVKSILEMEGMANSLRKELAQTIFNNIRTRASLIRCEAHPLLEDTKEKVAMLLSNAKVLLGHVKSETMPTSSASTAVRSSTPVPAISSEGSSSAPSSAISQDPFSSLKRLEGELDILERSYAKRKAEHERALRKELTGKILSQSLSQEAEVFIPRPSESARSEALRIAQKATTTRGGKVAKKAEKKKARVTSTAMSSSSSSAVSSTSSRAASSGPTRPHQGPSSLHHAVLSPNPRDDIDLFMTPLARKHFVDLKRVPGYEDKFYDYLDEIRADPWNRRGHGAIHTLGRTKLLKGYDNVFSKRFASKERLFYRVDKQDGGRVHVTILGLTKHDL